MASIKFSDLLDLLPRGDHFIAKKPPRGLSYFSGTNPRFVEPDLNVQKAIELGKTSVVILSAPGAVGKSTLAAELAWRTGAPLWDLSQFQVGSKTFSGTIFEAYDFEATGVIKRIGNGEFLFVLDALDEAQVRAGSQNFDAFLTDLATFLEEPRAKPTIVLLARSDTATWIELVLEDARVPLAVYEISYFDESQAKSFIEKRLDERRASDGKPALHRQQTKPFEDSRTALFTAIYTLFGVPAAEAWTDVRVRDFLGYAPVLEALSEYLDVTNYLTLVNEFQDDASSVNDPWEFLRDILRRLLDRESQKFREMVHERLEVKANEAEWDRWDELYTTDEQCARVLTHALDLKNGLGSPLPKGLANDYEEALKTFLPQHPFLAGRGFANVVFREFVYAWGVTRAVPYLATALRSTMRDREAPFLPSQLFSRFALAGQVSVTLDGQDIGPFYESLLARPAPVVLSLFGGEDGAQAIVSIDGDDDNETVLDVLDTGGGIHFWRRLKDASVDGATRVRIGLEGERFVLGPGVVVDSERFSVECDELDVDVQDDVLIEAREYSSTVHPLGLRIRNESTGGRLTVSWPNLGHPWATYRGRKEEKTSDMWSSARGAVLKKFIMMFRRQRTRKESTLRNARWSPDQLALRDELLDLALLRRVIRRVPGLDDRLELQSDYNSLRTLITNGKDIGSEAQAFVTEYLAGPLFGR